MITTRPTPRDIDRLIPTDAFRDEPTRQSDHRPPIAYFVKPLTDDVTKAFRE